MNGENEKAQQTQDTASVGPRYDPVMREKAMNECAKMVEVAKAQRQAVKTMAKGGDKDGGEE